MTDNTYNGWTNYETWAVNLYLGGNYDGEGTYREALDLVSRAAADYDQNNVRDGIWTKEQARLYSVEDALKTWFERSLPDTGPSIASDLLHAACGEINWRELADAKLAEVVENAAQA